MFSFLMRVENLDFSEALKQLAQQAGVALPERRDQNRREDDLLKSVNETAADFFHRQLTSDRSGAGARTYLEKRGLTAESIQRFQLGLSPGDGESLKGFLVSKGYDIEQLASAGLVTQNDRGGYRDMFRRRLMFPIWDPDGVLCPEVFRPRITRSSTTGKTPPQIGTVLLSEFNSSIQWPVGILKSR